jgi:hypothetical protein
MAALLQGVRRIHETRMQQEELRVLAICFAELKLGLGQLESESMPVAAPQLAQKPLHEPDGKAPPPRKVNVGRCGSDAGSRKSQSDLCFRPRSVGV